MLALVDEQYIPHCKCDYLYHTGVLQAGSLGNHDMPVIIAWVNKELEQEFCILEVILGMLIAVWEAIIPLWIMGHDG